MKKELVILIIAILVAVGLVIYYQDDLNLAQNQTDTQNQTQNTEDVPPSEERTRAELEAVLPGLPITQTEEQTVQVFETEFENGESVINARYFSDRSFAELSADYEAYIGDQGYELQDVSAEGDEPDDDFEFYFATRNRAELSVTIEEINGQRLVNIGYTEVPEFEIPPVQETDENQE